MGCTASDNRDDLENDEFHKQREIMIQLQNSVPKITNLEQLVTHIKKSKKSQLSIQDSQNVRGLSVVGKKQGFTNCDDGFFKWNIGKMIGKNVNLVKPFDSFQGKFDELLYMHTQKCLLGVKAEGTETGIYKIDTDGTIEKFKYKTGPLIENKKMSLGIYETYLSVQIDDQLFEIIGGLDQKWGFVVDKAIKVPESKIDKIVGIKIYDVKKIAVFGQNGTIIFYDIVNNSKVKLIYEKKCLIESYERVDTFDILVTGQIVAMTTRFKDKPTASKLLIYKVDPRNPSNKHWIFDFSLQPQKYTPCDFYSNFFQLRINYLHEGSPIIFGFQGSNEGQSTNLFVAVLEKEGIKELLYEVEFLKGEFIDATFYKNYIYSLDSLMCLKYIHLPLKQ